MLNRNRRAFLRWQVRRGGRLLFVDRPCLVACTIRDISEDGALLRLSEAQALPPLVLLWEEGTGSIHECRVQWRDGCAVGVHFTAIGDRAIRRAALEKGFAEQHQGAANGILLH